MARRSAEESYSSVIANPAYKYNFSNALYDYADNQNRSSLPSNVREYVEHRLQPSEEHEYADIQPPDEVFSEGKNKSEKMITTEKSKARKVVLCIGFLLSFFTAILAIAFRGLAAIGHGFTSNPGEQILISQLNSLMSIV